MIERTVANRDRVEFDRSALLRLTVVQWQTEIADRARKTASYEALYDELMNAFANAPIPVLAMIKQAFQNQIRQAQGLNTPDINPGEKRLSTTVGLLIQH